MAIPSTPNISRNTYQPLAHYDKVIQEQGVPDMDADFNEAQDIQRKKLMAVLSLFIGNGTVDNGYLIVGTGASNNFTIKAGNFLNAGYYCPHEADETYTAQADWLSAAPSLSPPVAGNRTDAIYLHVFEASIDSTFDSTIVNPTLNVETAQRTKIFRRVEVNPGGSTPVNTSTDFYVTLAVITRYAGQNAINPADVADARPILLNSDLVGEIKEYGGSSLPAGFLWCNGEAVSRTIYSNLFAVIGTSFGSGDGSTTFNVPDKRGRVSVGSGTATSGTTYTLGTIGGYETQTLTTTQLPNISYSVVVHDPTHGHGITEPNSGSGHYHSMPNTTLISTGNGVSRQASDQPCNWNQNPSTGYSVTGISINGNSTGITVSVTDSNGGGSHPIMQPWTCTNFVIKY